MRRVEFQSLAFKSSRSLISCDSLNAFRSRAPWFPRCCLRSAKRADAGRAPSRRASGTSRALNRQREYHGGKIRISILDRSGMLAARRFADRTPPFGILSAFVIARRFFFFATPLSCKIYCQGTCVRGAPGASTGCIRECSTFIRVCKQYGRCGRQCSQFCSMSSASFTVSSIDYQIEPIHWENVVSMTHSSYYKSE